MAVLDAFDLTGRVCVVTGANRGIGRALSVALAEAGGDLALVVRRPDSAEPLLKELRALGVRAEVFAADVVDPSAVKAAAAQVVAAFGGVDVLVNNAGTCIHRPALEVTEEEFHAVMDVNVTGVWNCCQAFGRVMVEAGRGSIVNTSTS
jgi:NAD(P)-dependent dehydrogenase (short-subunit alcohol dehydrogenase family)